jgi:tRNA-specific 2-thiouridylase
VIASKDAIGSRELDAVRPRFVCDEPEDGGSFEAVVRYRGEPSRATYERSAEGFRLRFERPVRAVAPGQAVVLYRKDEVIGGGTIARAG